MKTSSFRLNSSLLTIAAVAGLLLSAPMVTAQSGDESPGRAVDPSGDVAMPSSAQIMANPYLRNALSRSTEGLVFQRGPDGAISVDLQGRFQNVSVARIDADGEIRMGCVSTHDSLAEFLAAHPDASEQDYIGEAKGHGDDR